MPRYLVERSFPEGLHHSLENVGAESLAAIVAVNSPHAVTWLHSYARSDQAMTSCVHDAPNPEVIRQTARADKLPVDRITEVRVLNPYFYTESLS